MNDTKKNSSLLPVFIFLNSLITIGILAFFGYKFSQNEYSRNDYFPSDEMIEMCRSSSFCFIDKNSKTIDLLSFLSKKSKEERYDYTLIINSIPEPEPINDSEYSYITESSLQPLLRKYETLGDYCRDADLCLSKKNVSLDQMQNDIESIGAGKKSIKFYMDKAMN